MIIARVVAVAGKGGRVQLIARPVDQQAIAEVSPLPPPS